MSRGLRATVLFHEGDALGAGLAVARIAELVRSWGWSLSAFLGEPGPIAAALGEEWSTVTLSEAPKPLAYSFSGWRRPPGVRSRLRATPSYLGSVERALLDQRPHVVHANTLLSLPEATVARRLGLPVVVHVHEEPRPSLKRALTLRWAVSVADVIVAVSESVARMLRPVARQPVVVVQNGVPTTQAERATGGRPGEIVVGTVGAVSRRKGTDVFIEAAKIALERNPALRFEHVGPSGTSGDPRFERNVAEAAAGVRGLVMRGRQDGVSAMREWDVVVLPSIQDPFPLVVLEAMELGKPVIASAVGGVPEQIVDGESGLLVPPGSASRLADAVLQLGADHARRGAIGAAARERAHGAFRLERQASELAAVYGLALERRWGWARRVRP